jgi:uncharacterized glyoxalase superfamily protein PhnB
MSDPADSEILDVFPYLCVRGAADAIDFYAAVFGARVLFRLDEPGGRVAHAELAFGPVRLMLADEHPEAGAVAPDPRRGSGVTLHLHVRDVDAMTARAVAAGAVLVRPPRDEGHGERQSRLRDPFGHDWLLGQEIESLSDEEIARRFRQGRE